MDSTGILFSPLGHGRSGISAAWAQLTTFNRQRMIGRRIEQGIDVRNLVAQAGISLRTAYK